MAKKYFIGQLKKQLRQNKYLNPVVTAVGLFFIFLAILGAFLPLIPGFVFLVIGLIILGEEFFLTRWIIKKSPRQVRDRLEKRKNNTSAQKITKDKADKNGK